jgi:hypothetical protein
MTMNDYTMPSYHGKTEVEYCQYNDASQCKDAEYPATWALPVPMQACGNIMCTQETAAVFCSNYCRETMEGIEEDAQGDTVDAPLTEADLDALLTAYELLRTEREYLALTAMGPDAYCEAQQRYYRAQEPNATVFLGDKKLIAQQAERDGESLAKLVCGYR